MRIFTLFTFLLLATAAAIAQPTVNFETGGAGAGYTWNVFENGNNPPLEIVANPSATGINTSATVAKFTARQAGNPWAGTENANGSFPTFNFTTSNSIVKIMVYKTVLSDVGMKFANPTGGAQLERKVANTKINEWEELTFDFSNLVGSGLDGSVNISQIIVFPDFNARTQENIIYFDNITFSASGGGGSTTPSLPLDFESSTIPYTFTDFGGGASTVISNPQNNGINTSAKVGRMVKSAPEVWGGSLISLGAPIDFSVNKTFKVKVFMPKVGAKLLLKVENQTNGGIFFEKEAIGTVANAWEELTFDYSTINTANQYQKVVLIFDLGTVGDGGANFTYLFDDIRLVSGSGPPPGGNAPTVNFETGGAGAGYTWNVFENGNNPPLEIVANPSATGINTSATVAKFTARQAGNPWAGTENANGAFPTFNFSASNSIVKIMVYKTVLSDVGMKFANPTGGAQPERKVRNTKINEWEELTFDFSNLVGSGLDGSVNISQIIVFPDFNARTQDNIIYFDNITFSAAGGGPPPASAPTTAAPTPTRAAANVISLFSNAYTNRTINTWRTDWSNATLTDLQVAGNDTKRYTNLDFVGVEATGTNSINASTMLFFHIDAWTPNMTTFRIKIVDFGADNAFGGGDDKEHELSFTPTQGQWNGYEIPLTDFTGLTTKSNISQIIFSGLPTAAGTLFIDNMYFHNVTGGGPPPSAPTTAAPTPTRAAANVISLFSNAYTNRSINTWRTDWSNATLTDLQVAGNDTKRYTNLDFVGVEATGTNSINASTMLFFHIDAWTPNMTTFRIKMVDFGANNAFGGGDDKEHELTFTPTQGQWNGYEIPLTDFTGLTTKSNISQIIFSGLPTATGTLFIDNVYFHNVTGGGPPPSAPTTAAPTPTRAAANVISLFSNAYTNRTINTWRTDWSNATLTDLQVAGNDTKRYTNLDFVGVEAVGPNSINASSMMFFHIDAWTPNMTTFRIKMVDFGADNAFGGGDDKEHELSFTPTQGQWNAYDIPFTDFTGLTTKSNISQIIFSGLPTAAGTLFIDNVYFYNNNPTVGSQTITFPAIADRTVGNPSFQLTATASSNLPVVYTTVSNKITISGSTVTIVSAGRVEIKANQPGNSSFTAAPEVTRSFCIRPVKPTVTAAGTDVETITLTSSATTGNRWFLNGTVIPSATNATFAANQPGIYKVQVTIDDCVSEFSSDVPLIVTGDLPGNINAINVYPNPAEDYLELVGIKGDLSNVQLVDLAGRRNSISFEKRGEVYQANVQHLNLGIYLLQVQDGAIIHRVKVIKK